MSDTKKRAHARQVALALLGAAISAALPAAAQTTADRAAERLRLDIPAQALSSALTELIRGFPLLARLRERGAVYEAYIYPGAYHLKLRPQQMRAVQARSIDFIERHLATH